MKKPASFLLLALLLSSCIHYYYVPSAQNVPLFREKKEYRFSGAYGLGSEASSFELQGAYSVTDKLAVMSDFMFAKGIENNTESWAKGTYLDAAIGYFSPMRKSGVFEVYGGLGGSRQHHQYIAKNLDLNNPENYNFDAGRADLSFIKLFIQPSIGMRFNHFEFAFSTRFNNLSYFKANNQIDRLLNKVDFEKFNATASTKNFLFFEPALTIRGGWKYVKIQLQGATGSYLNNDHYNFDQFHLSAGFNVVFAKRSAKDVSK